MRVISACAALLIVASTWTVGSAADDPGQRVYEDKCSRCHGAEARGSGKAPQLVPFGWSYEQALKLVRDPECDMPPMSPAEVSDEQVAQIVAYLKTIKPPQ
jgi:mono/diheme cytochrome c family protein